MFFLQCICIQHFHHKQDVTQDQFFEYSLRDSNPEFSFSWTGCHTIVKELSLPNYLLIAGGRIVGCIPFPRILAQVLYNLAHWAWTHFSQPCCLIHHSGWACLGSSGSWLRQSDMDSGKLAFISCILRPAFLEPQEAIPPGSNPPWD